MNRRTRIVAGAILAAIIWMGSAPPAGAYLDPGSGSYLIQLLIGGLLGAGLAVKMFWARITSVFRRSKPSTDGSSVEAPSTDEG